MYARKPYVPHDNFILSALPNDSRSRLNDKLKIVSLPLGTDLYAPYERIKHIHFPIAAIASIIASTSDGQTSEVGLVGPEGAVGLETLMGVDSVPYRCTIQHADSGYRLPIEIVREEFRRGGVPGTNSGFLSKINGADWPVHPVQPFPQRSRTDGPLAADVS